MTKENVDSPREIVLSKVKPILSSTDLKGRIKYCNPYFAEICGYTEKELVGSPHNIIRHPDMPKVIFKLMWERIEKNEDILAVVKNKTKDGNFYWVTTSFETKYHPLTKEVSGYLALRHAAPKDTVREITPLYKKLISIEEMSGVVASEAYLIGYLESKNKTYDEYIQELTKYKGLVAVFFNGMRKMFS